MSPDDELRALLEKIAATVGDPPEHGLDGVADRRRRRTRHRRGAVATAVTLAVIGLTVVPRLGGEDHDVTAGESPDASSRQAELPDVVQLHCSPNGIDVPVASIRPQEDGLHLVVENTLGRPTDVWVTSTSSRWDSGRVVVQQGRTELWQPIPPGVLTVGCQVGTEEENRRVTLVDVNGIYEVPELDCADEEQQELVNLEIEPIDRYRDAADAVANVLDDYLRETDDIVSFSGYPQRRFDYATVDRTAQIKREGDTVAFVHLTGEADSSQSERPERSPWVGAERVEACARFLDDQSLADETGADDGPTPAE